MGRRRFLTVTAAAAALAFSTDLPARGASGSRELDAARIGSDPFTLGVASEDPLPDSVLLWTRLAPAPFEPDGEYVVVRCSGTALAYPEYHHTLHVDVAGLDPGLKPV